MPHTTELYEQLHLLREGSLQARESVIEHTCGRLRKLARKMLQGFPVVRRWSETDDVLQAALLRLHRALAAVHPQSPAEFYGLAAMQIRRELLDLAKRYQGPQGLGASHQTDSGSLVAQRAAESVEPADVEAWSRFHESVDLLPREQRAVVDLLWYEGFSQPEAAGVLGISLATLKRRWASARIQLCEVLEDWIIE